MSWKYGLKRKLDGEDYYYELVELYSDDDGNWTSWTDAITFGGDTIEEVQESLIRALHDISINLNIAIGDE